MQKQFCSTIVASSGIFLNLWLLTAICMIFGGCRQENVKAKTSSWDKSYNYGVVFVTPEKLSTLDVTHSFKVTNHETEQIQLKFVGSSCGCATPQIKKSILNPGESTVVDMKVTVRGRSGKNQQYTVIGTGNTRVPEFRLTMSIMIIPRLETVGLHGNIYSVERGGSQEFVFKVLTRTPLTESEANLRLVDVESDSLFSAKSHHVDTQIINNQFKLTTTNVHIQLRCPKHVEDPNQLLQKRTLRFVSGDSFLEKPILWKADVPILAKPSRVFLKRLPEKEVSHIVRLKSANAFSVIDIDGVNDKLRLEVTKSLSQKSHEIKIVASEPWNNDRPQIEKFLIRIRTDHPEHEIVRLPVHILNAQ